jgi:concanavalin A-like lectin/glucanase superfamily protein
MPDLKVEVAFNANVVTPAASRTWTDISDFVELDQGIEVEFGRGNEFSLADANGFRVALDNRDGRFTPKKTSSPYYPSVTIGKPIRFLASTLPNGTFEDDAAGWAGTNATLARSTAQFHAGVASLSLTATAAATMSADTPSGTAGVPVVAGKSYVAGAWFRSAVTARTCNVLVDWYTGAGALISTSTSAGIVDSSAAWLQARITATAPATAEFARVRAQVTSPAASEVHYVDDAELSSVRFLGFVDEWPIEWDGTDATAVATVTASSRLARLGVGNELRSIIEEEILATEPDPAAYYTLGEAAGATSAFNLPAPGRFTLTQAGSGTDVVFGNATGPGTDGLTAATFAAGGKYLATTFKSAASPRVLECWFNCAAAAHTALADLLHFQVGILGAEPGNLALSINASAQLQGTVTGDGPTTLTVSSAATVNDGLTHHAAVRVTGASPLQLELYLDGVLVANTSGGTTMPTNVTGPLLVGVLSGSSAPTISIAHGVLYTTSAPPTGTDLANHATAGSTGGAGETPAARLTRYASYVGIAAAERDLEAGMVPDLAHIDTTGRTVLDCMRAVEATEEGVLFDAREGLLTFHARNHRYIAASAFTLSVALQQVEDGLAPTYDRFGLINGVAARSSDGKVAVLVVNSASQAAFGSARKSLELATTNTDEPLQHASWLVNQYGADVRPRIPSVPVSALPLGAPLLAELLAADVGTRFTLAGLPSQWATATQDVFVEGGSEVWGPESVGFSFNVSPAEPFDVWTVEDAVLGQYDAYPIAF